MKFLARTHKKNLPLSVTFLNISDLARLLWYEWWLMRHKYCKCKCYLSELTTAYSWTAPARPGNIAFATSTTVKVIPPSHRAKLGRTPTRAGPFDLVASFYLATVPEVWPVSSWSQLYGQGVGSIPQLTHPPLHKSSVHRPEHSILQDSWTVYTWMLS